MDKKDRGSQLTVELGEDLVEQIDHLVDETGQFKSRDDFIELACHELIVRRKPAGDLLGCICMFFGTIAIGFIQDMVEPAIAILSYFQA